MGCSQFHIDENYKYNLNGETDSIRTNNYWLGTTSDKSLYDYLGYLTDSDNKKMRIIPKFGG